MAASEFGSFEPPSEQVTKSNFQLFGITHLAIIGAIVLIAAVLAWLQRLWPASKALRLSLALMLLADTLWWNGYLAWHGQISIRASFPVELCDLALYLTIIVLFTLSAVALDLAYYFALAGTSMAVLTPDLWERFPSLATVQFFVAHGLVVAAVLYLVWSRQARPRAGSVWRAMVGLNVWAAIDAAIDCIFKTNYMYLRAKPAHVSLLDLLGPWPWYIVIAEGVALAFFLLLSLPFRRAAARGR